MEVGFEDGIELQSMEMGILQEEGFGISRWKLKLQAPYKGACLTCETKL